MSSLWCSAARAAWSSAAVRRFSDHCLKPEAKPLKSFDQLSHAKMLGDSDPETRDQHWTATVSKEMYKAILFLNSNA
jgi:hypothetical protein